MKSNNAYIMNIYIQNTNTMHVQLSTGLKHQHTQNSRQLWGGWVGPTLYAISIQKKLLTIVDGP